MTSHWRSGSHPSHSRWRAFFLGLFIALVLLVGQNSPLTFGMGSTPAHAASLATPSSSTPNRMNPQTGAQSHSRSYTPAPMGNQPPHPPQIIPHPQKMSMQPATLDLKAGQAVQMLGSDGHLEVRIPATAITATDLAQAGGKLSLRISQIAPGSGSNAGGSGHLSFGTYLLQLVDAKGNVLSHGLRTPITALYHFSTKEGVLNLGHAYVVLNGTRSQGVASAPLAKGVAVDSTFGPLASSPVTLDPKQHTMTVTPLLGTPSTSLSWQSDASIASFGKPDPFAADLNAGALTASYPIDVPAGPGGLTPPVTLAYNSAGVSEQHNPSAAVGWVGEGWTLSMGSINWAEHNVLAGCQSTCGTNWENSWQLSDPFGTGSELIPPNINVSTYFDDTANFYCGTGNPAAFPCPILWHTANESYAKIYAYVGPFAIAGSNSTVHPPCFRVWLKNGLMEEFGCTTDSLQYSYEPGNGQGAVVSGWNLDLITDPQGNQIHLTYQQDMESWTNPVTHATFNYPRDVVLSTIEYDSPACHDAQNMCTGSTWAPLARVNFASGHSPTRNTGIGSFSGCNTGANLRCDDPLDLSGSGGVAAPVIQSTFVLNDVQVQVRSSGTASWNTLRDYQLSYEQSAPTTITDPSSGRQQSVAGLLDLLGLQQVGDTGANAILYSGNDTNTSTSFAYMKAFDVSTQHVVIGPSTTLTYWIYPQSSATTGLVGAGSRNSTCVAVDMLFSDNSSLRDSGAVDQNGVRVHPAQQCGHLTLDQWNRVTSNIGAVLNGKTLNTITIGYDQPANTGGYRGFVDDISLTNPTSSTPLWSSTLESGDQQQTWSNTALNSTSVQNVNGICCGLSGPELFTQQQSVHTDKATLPLRTFSYTALDSFYVDSFYHPNPSTNCGPSWNTGNGSGCLLWAQSHANNDRYLSSASNGMGLAQTFSWSLARNNSHGVPGGGSNNADPLYCNSHQSGYPCNEADDSGWSRAVQTSESSTTIRLMQNGQGGTQTSTPVTSATNYSYRLSYPLVAQECSDCVAGMYWGNQNDVDYLGYYNGKFMGFTQTSVSHADGSLEVHNYFGTEGWGIYDTGQSGCFTTAPCHNDPWWDLTNVAHGHETQASYYDTDGTTLLKHTTSSYQAVCPPSGVAGTPSSSQYGTFDGKLVSALDHNNPVAVCDVQQTQSVSQVSNGTANNVTTTTAWNYDNFGRVTQETITSNGGTPGTVIHKPSYIWNSAITATQSSASGTYILDRVAFTDTEDSAGNRLSCSYTSFDGQSYATGQSSGLTGGLATTQDRYSNCGTPANGFTTSGQIRTTTTYDTYGNQVASSDPDANASISGHTGCTVGSTQYTSCSAYDGTFQVLPTSSSNALNQTSSMGYTATAAGGFGLWPTSTTDVNSQATTYGYDTLGRMTSIALPAEASGSTKTWSYTTWCTDTTAQASCVELDEVDRMNASTTVTTRGFYDGEGRLIETRVSGPNNQDVVTYANYDIMGRKIFTSSPYFVTAYTGPSGPSAFSLPDSSQPGSSTAYPNLRQTTVTDALSHATTTTASVQCSVAGTSDTGCYVLGTLTDANSHQQSTLTDGLGHQGYDLRYTGNSSATYALYALTSYTYDQNGNLLTIKHPANNATTSFTYDAVGRRTGMNDPDRGVESYSYDPNSNLTQSVDARGSAGTIFQGYDGLNRLVWRNSTNSPTGARVTYSYDSTANGNMGVGRKTGESFSGSGGLSGSYAFVYDQRGQQTSMTTTINGTNYPVQASYDDAGDLTSQTYPTGEVVNATYSAQGWLSQLTTTKAGTTTTLASNISYTGPAGASVHITSMVLGNGVYGYAANYDLDQRLTSSSLTRSSDSTLLYQTQPGYDAAGNVSNVTTTLQAGTDIQHFCYDEQNRLTAASANGTASCGSFATGTLTSAQYQQSDTYDPNGRLTSGPQGSYSYGSSSHLHAVTSTGNGYSAAYDAAGNMTCRAPSSTTTCSGTQTGQQLSYDPEGNLSTWQNQPSPTSTVNYLYDGEGTRVASQLVSGGTTTLTSYIGQVETIVAGSASTTTTYYSAGALRIAEAVNGTFSYLGNDALGSTAVALNASGQLTAAQLYGPYGNVRYSSGTMPTDIGFTGQRGDSPTGLDYYNARYYDPVVGQFISADAVLPGGGFDPWGLSRYAYVQGNPETKIDPTGHRQEGIDDGSSANIDPQGTLTIWTPFASYGGGHGYNENGNYAYHVEHYTRKQQKQPSYHPRPQENAVAKTIRKISNWLTYISYAGRAGMGACLLSFAPATKVATAQGAKAIGSLHPGVKVWAYNTKTHKMELQPIVHVWINHDDDLVDLTVTSKTSAQHGKPEQKTVETIHTNQKHPFLTVEKGFVPVSHLSIGMHLVKADGGIGVVTKLETIPGAMAMYNLEVAQDHTFTVGAGEWIVHNCGGVDPTNFNNDFKDIQGMSYDDIVSKIPDGAVSRPFDGAGGVIGVEWTWKETAPNGLTYTYTLRLHSPDPDAIANYPGSNAAKGWVARFSRTGPSDPSNPSLQGEGTYYQDSNGNWHPIQETDPRYGPGVSPKGTYDPDVADSTHIPIDDPDPATVDALWEMLP